LIGHVERTNDRDYEIEERYVYAQLWVKENKKKLIGYADDTGLWRLRPIDCRRKRKGIWIRCEVDLSDRRNDGTS